jgi:hypothetical protein
MALKLPPPPPIATGNPQFNRWLLEITSILSAAGGIDPSQIPGYSALQAQVAALESTTGGQGSSISLLQLEVNANSSSISTLFSDVASINSELTTLGANAVVHSGAAAPVALFNNGDWYAKTGAPGHIYVQVAGAWVLIV